MDETVARTIVERLLLNSDDQVVGTEGRGPAVIVASARKQWLIEALEPAAQPVRSVPCSMYEVTSPVLFDGPFRSAGVAVLAGGSLFNLSEEGGLEALFRRIGAAAQPIEIASLLARYYTKGPHVARHQNLVIQPHDLAGLLEARQIDALAEFTPLRSAGAANGSLEVEFCTFSLGPEPPDNVIRVSVLRWHARLDPQGVLRVSVRPIARCLDSPRYAPR